MSDFNIETVVCRECPTPIQWEQTRRYIVSRVDAELTRLRAQVARLDERVRLLNDECWAWRNMTHDVHTKLCDIEPDPKCKWCNVAHKHGVAKARAESDAASAVKEPA